VSAVGGAPQTRYALLVLPATVLFLPVYVAIALVVVVSFLRYDDLRSGIIAPTIANYSNALFDSFSLGILFNTILVGLIVGVISAAAALPMAISIVRTQRRSIRLALIAISVIPFLVNALVRVFAWTTVLGREGLINFFLVHLALVQKPRSLLRTEMAVIVGQIYFVLPVCIITITTLMAKLKENLGFAASTLGAGPWRTFFSITLPLLLPATFSAALVAYALTISAFVVPMILGGDQFKMYSNLIYDQVTFSGDFGIAAAMSIILLICSLVLAAALRQVLRRSTGR
jgi:putative spermidine/putrescine transport system permease protein